jgi:hypothetical protein
MLVSIVKIRRRFASLLVGASCLAACSAKSRFDSRLRALAGDQAKDCGSVTLEQNPAAAIECAREAVAAHAPFRVALAIQGIDSAITQGLAASAQGGAVEIVYDSDTSGGSSLFARPSLTEHRCTRLDFGADRRGRPKITCVQAAAEPLDAADAPSATRR